MNPILMRNKDRQKPSQPKFENQRANKVRENCKIMITECLQEENNSEEKIQSLIEPIEVEIYNLSQKNENSKNYRELINTTKMKLKVLLNYKGLKNQGVRQALIDGILQITELLQTDIADLQNNFKSQLNQERTSSPQQKNQLNRNNKIPINFQNVIGKSQLSQQQRYRTSIVNDQANVQQEYNLVELNSYIDANQSQENYQESINLPENNQIKLNQEQEESVKINDLPQNNNCNEPLQQIDEPQIIQNNNQEPYIDKEEIKPEDSNKFLNNQDNNIQQQNELSQSNLDNQNIYDLMQSQIDEFNNARKNILKQSIDNKQSSDIKSSVQQSQFQKSRKISQEINGQENSKQQNSITENSQIYHNNEKIINNQNQSEINQNFDSSIQKQVHQFPFIDFNIKQEILEKNENAQNRNQFELNHSQSPIIQQNRNLQHFEQNDIEKLKQENELLRKSIQTIQQIQTNGPQIQQYRQQINQLQEKYDISQKELLMIKEHLNIILSENSRFKQQYQNLKSSMENEKEWLILKVNQLTQQIHDNEYKIEQKNHQYDLQVQKCQQKQDKIDNLLQVVQNKEQIIQSLLDANKQMIKKCDESDLNIMDHKSNQRSVQQLKIYQNLSQYEIESIMCKQENYTNQIDQSNYDQRSQKSYKQQQNDKIQPQKQIQKSSRNKNIDDLQSQISYQSKQNQNQQNMNNFIQQNYNNQQPNFDVNEYNNKQNDKALKQSQEQKESWQQDIIVLQQIQVQEQDKIQNNIDQIQEINQESQNFEEMHQNNFFQNGSSQNQQNINFINPKNLHNSRYQQQSNNKNQKPQRQLYQANLLFQDDQNQVLQQEMIPELLTSKKENPNLDDGTPQGLKRQNSVTSIVSINSIQTEGNKKQREKKRVIPNTMFE